MDSAAFDRIARLLGAAASRRSGLKAALGASLGLALAPDDGSADRGKRRHGNHRAHETGGRRRGQPNAEGPCKENRCKRNGDCCTGFCLIAKGEKKGKCRCISVGQPCKKKQTCCGTLACKQGVCTSTVPVKIDTGAACAPGDICKNAVAACVAYETGTPAGTYCLYPHGTPCGKNEVCATGACRNGACGPAGIANGGACTPSDRCLDANASCTTYAANGPAGTFCLLPATTACAADEDCVSAFCAGNACAAKCTVCASGCDYDTISGAYAAASSGGEIGVAPGAYDETDALEIDKDINIRRCGLEGTVAWTSSTYQDAGL
ncbi:MAG: hypothetical protein ACKOWF_19400, partial [Chloroflexota bacterium]